MICGSTLAGFGHAVPERVVPNAEIEAQLDLEEGWIFRRTGIRSRRWAADHDTLTDLASAAGKAALISSGLGAEAIGMVLLATSTPDHLLPPSAPLVAHKIGLPYAGGVDMAGACAGFIYALAAADSHARLWGKAVLVIAANILSRRINPHERASSVLFADAAGAVVVKPVPETTRGILGLDMASAGSLYDLVHIPAGGSNRPFAEGMPVEDTRMTMTGGRELFAQAVAMMTRCAQTALQHAALPASAMNYFVPHQANARIFELIAHNLKVPENTMLRSIGEYGNSSAATIPLTLALTHQQRPFQCGQHLLLTGAGAGLTGGAVVLRL